MDHMPHYYLHVIDDDRIIEDPEGAELADLDAAEQEALRAARQLWAAAILEQRDIGQRRFGIADDNGACLRIVEFDQALPLPLQARLRAI